MKILQTFLVSTQDTKTWAHVLNLLTNPGYMKNYLDEKITDMVKSKVDGTYESDIEEEDEDGQV